MSRFKPARPSPALVVSIIALIAALGGTAYAATSLPKNSVGTKQLKKNAVTTAKIKNGAVTGKKIKLGTLGTVPSANHANSADSATNANHASSADNANHANSADSATNAGSADNATNANHANSADNATNAATASVANSPGTLGSGQTETGMIYDIVPDNGVVSYEGSPISFSIPLAAAPTPHYVTSPTAACPGSSTNPTATSGNLCVYQVYNSTTNTPGFEFPSRYGAGLYIHTKADSSYTDLVARWAVTG